MGEYLPQYQLIEAAKWLEVAPWELLKQSRIWIAWALNHKAATLSVKGE